MGCRFDGECEFKVIQKSVARGNGSRDSYRIYCTWAGACNQKVFNASKCATPVVDNDEDENS